MIKDSGERTEFETGFVRDMHTGKGRMDLLPWNAIMEVSQHCEEGALKYGERNIDKGAPLHSLLDSGARHLAKYIAGQADEDHLRAACWNLLFALEQRTTHPELCDIPAIMKIEEWRQSEYENFEVSNLGRIRNKKNKRILQGTVNQKGYVTVCLSIDGKSKTKRLHRIVAKSFIKNPNNYPEINHKDGNKLNNAIYNLEWVTHEENISHAVKAGLRDNVNRKVTEEEIYYIRKTCKKGDAEFGVRPLARKLGLSHTTVKDIVNGKRWANISQRTTHPDLNDMPWRNQGGVNYL